MSDLQCEEVVLETEITNKAALSLYENLGFIRDKRLCKYYMNGVDAFRLKLFLNNGPSSDWIGPSESENMINSNTDGNNTQQKIRHNSEEDINNINNNNNNNSNNNNSSNQEQPDSLQASQPQQPQQNKPPEGEGKDQKSHSNKKKNSKRNKKKH